MNNVTNIRKFMYKLITKDRTYYIECNDNKSLEYFYSKGLDKTLQEVNKYPYKESYINIKGGVIIENNHNKNSKMD